MTMEPFIGQITLFPYTFAPANWAPCDGQLLPISQHTALFSLIGVQFGGDGKTTFALPNYANNAPPSSKYYIAINGVYPSRPEGAVR
jgi:microcystin-dependent protein